MVFFPAPIHGILSEIASSYNYSKDLQHINISNVQSSRKTTLQYACRNQTSAFDKQTLSITMLDFLYVHEGHKVIFCLVPKAGCTNMKRMLVTVSTEGKLQQAEEDFVHDMNKLYPLGIRRLSNYSEHERSVFLENYYKVAVVRNPYIRWLSAYRDKFKVGHQPFADVVGREILQRYRPNATEWDLNHGETVTFHEFILHLITIGAQHSGFDDHWGPLEASCNPCNVNYDYIAKVETLAKDMDFIKHRIYHDSPYVTLGSMYNASTNMDILNKFYGDISHEDIRTLMTLYVNDFEMFNYHFPVIQS